MGDEQSQTRMELEAAVHLIRAGRELLAASKAVIEGLDALLEVLETRVASGAKPPAPIQAIPIRRNAKA